MTSVLGVTGKDDLVLAGTGMIVGRQRSMEVLVRNVCSDRRPIDGETLAVPTKDGSGDGKGGGGGEDGEDWGSAATE